MQSLQRKPNSRRNKPPITVLAGVREQTPTFSTDILKALNLVLGPK